MANIVICADGTWNRPEDDIEKNFPTNVLKLARSIAPNSREKKQHVFYDWGLGTHHSSIISGATGRGIHKNILDGYRYIVQNYAAGDQIYLFGFSRGAYTVRALCGLINNCGIVKRKDAKLINHAWGIYKSPAKKNHPNGNNAQDFRRSHCHRSRKVHFVGVWETVGALGIPSSVMGLLDGNDEFYDTKMGGNVQFARHGLAIDEKRVDFQPTIWRARTGVDLKQVWFCGSHSDIGGSYPPDKDGRSVADITLGWMMDEASRSGFDPGASFESGAFKWFWRSATRVQAQVVPFQSAVASPCRPAMRRHAYSSERQGTLRTRCYLPPPGTREAGQYTRLAKTGCRFLKFRF